MIEVNLIPDVKKDLLKTKRTQNFVISIAIIAGIISIAIVVLLWLWVHVAMGAITNNNENKIEQNQASIEAHQNPSAEDVLTIQSQLQNISDLQSRKYLASRIFGIVNAIRLSADEAHPVTFQTLTFDQETSTISIGGESISQFAGVEAFKKAAELTKFTYADESGEPVPDNLIIPDMATWITGAQDLVEDADGNRVVRFEVSFVIDPEALRFDAFDSEIFEIQPPGAQNVTDSVTQIPIDMFTQATQEEEEQ